VLLGRTTVRLTLILNEREAEALRRIASPEDQPPREQARRLLREALVNAGALGDQQYDPLGSPDRVPAA
jgi:hypothetical protein